MKEASLLSEANLINVPVCVTYEFSDNTLKQVDCTFLSIPAALIAEMLLKSNGIPLEVVEMLKTDNVA